MRIEGRTRFGFDLGWANLRSQKVGEVVHRESCIESGVGIYRRCSGGGAVLHGEGNLNLSLVLDREYWKIPLDPKSSFLWCGRFLTDWLSSLGLNTGVGRISDILAGHESLRKVSGTAQARRGSALLWHGTLLLRELEEMERFLPIPPDRPGIPHSDYLSNLSLLGVPQSVAEAEAGWKKSVSTILKREIVEIEPETVFAKVKEFLPNYPNLSFAPWEEKTLRS